MAHSSYGAADITVVISHPSIGQLELFGTGFDNITFALAEDRFVHDWAADGSVMTSKQEAKHGTVAITVQQTSEAHAWLTRAYNYISAAPLREGARFGLEAHASDMRVSHVGEYMSIQKRPDKP